MSNEELIAEARERAAKYTGGPEADRLWRLADALEAAQPKTVTTPEELDALPIGTIIKDAEGYAWHLDGYPGEPAENEWQCTYTLEPIKIDFGPFTILFTPPATETENT